MLCDACQANQASDHITLQVSIVSSTRNKTKIVQFWLCEDCEQSSQQILTRDELQRHRVAFRFVDNPSFMSPSSKWRKKALRKPAIHV
jgi:protein-arginine kinase activator protein McsA